MRSGRTVSDLVATASTGRRRSRAISPDQVAIARPDPLVAREADPDDVDLRPRAAYEVVEPLAEQRAWPVQAGGVDEDELGIRAVHQTRARRAGWSADGTR
jgi:hypothetical protein